jgi:hypothetical protein
VGRSTRKKRPVRDYDDDDDDDDDDNNNNNNNNNFKIPFTLPTSYIGVANIH